MRSSSTAKPFPASPFPSTSVTTMANQVFDVAELLEMVLSGLDMTDLAVSQSVCHQWRSAILSSPDLQRKLYLRPIVTIPQLDVIEGLVFLTAQDVITDLAEPGYYRSRVKRDSASKPETIGEINYMKVNPVIDNLTKCGAHDELLAFEGRTLLHMKGLKDCRQRMFLTQPPCVAVGISGRTMRCSTSYYFSNSILTNAEGITLGQLISHTLCHQRKFARK